MIFNKMRNLLCSNNPYSFKQESWDDTCIQCCYGVEGCALKQKIIEEFWLNKVTNKEVVRRMRVTKEIMNATNIRQNLCHIIPGNKYNLLRNIIYGKTQSRRSIVRRCVSLHRTLRKWYSNSLLELFRAAASKVKTAERKIIAMCN